MRPLGPAMERFGRAAVVAAVRRVLADARKSRDLSNDDDFASRAAARLEDEARPNLRPVFNLTGTVLHTNLGRAVIAEAAVEAATVAMRNAVALEFDLGGGRRGERDELVRELLCELTGAEDATVVNNNAAAVLLVLNTLSRGREAIVSRGELIEIGGAFRMPEIMSRAGAKLKEVGTTNRTHKKDYLGALGPKTGLILKVHTSNYRIEGFTKEVARPRSCGTCAPAQSATRQRPRFRHAWSICRASVSRMNRPSQKQSPTAPISSPSPATSCLAARKPVSSLAARC